MTLIKSFSQAVSGRFLTVMTLCWLSIENAFATGGGGGGGINANKIPGVDSNTKDPMEIIYLVAKSLATLAAILFAAWAILTVVKALVKTYNSATDEADRKGWGPFVIALILGFILIFFSLWLVKMAIGLF